MNAGIAYLKLGRLEQARQKLETALSISRRSPRALNALGVVYSRLGQPAKAMEAWAQCVRVDPTQYDALYNLGRVAGELDDWPRARQALTQFVRHGAAEALRKRHPGSARRAGEHAEAVVSRRLSVSQLSAQLKGRGPST